MNRRRGGVRAAAVVLLTAVGLVGLVPAASAAAPVVVPAVVQAAPRTVEATLRPSHTTIVKGEMVWFGGAVRTSSGKGVKGVKVRLERRVSGTWKKVAGATTKSGGKFAVRHRPTKATSYRVRVLGTSKVRKAVSAKRAITFVKEDRTISERRKVLGSRVGAPRTTLREADLGDVLVRWRDYAKLMLVEVEDHAKTRTWLVQGAIRDAYLAEGGSRGSLGVPVADPKCGLLEAGCVQRFTGGAIYHNKNLKKPSVFHGTGRRTELIAAALSQVGFAEKRNNTSKYNKWTRSLGQPWCSAFQSWVAAASGNPDVVPKKARLRQLVRTLRATSPERFSKTPKVGALVFFDNSNDGVAEPTHVGLVVEVRKDTIVTVEGNTSNPQPSGGNGVFQKIRARSHPIYYWYPKY